MQSTTAASSGSPDRDRLRADVSAKCGFLVTGTIALSLLSAALCVQCARSSCVIHVCHTLPTLWLNGKVLVSRTMTYRRLDGISVILAVRGEPGFFVGFYDGSILAGWADGVFSSYLTGQFVPFRTVAQPPDPNNPKLTDWDLTVRAIRRAPQSALPGRYAGIPVPVILAACLVILACALIRDRRRTIQAIRRQAGQCHACGYSLHMLASDRCPECGTVTSLTEVRSPPTSGDPLSRVGRSRRALGLVAFAVTSALLVYLLRELVNHGLAGQLGRTVVLHVGKLGLSPKEPYRALSLLFPACLAAGLWCAFCVARSQRVLQEYVFVRVPRGAIIAGFATLVALLSGLVAFRTAIQLFGIV